MNEYLIHEVRSEVNTNQQIPEILPSLTVWLSWFESQYSRISVFRRNVGEILLQRLPKSKVVEEYLSGL